MKMPRDVSEVLEKIESNGFDAYLAGGSVRDSLLNGSPKDYDIATDAKPREIEVIFKGKKILDVGKRFGTLILILKDRQIEITTFRSDGTYSDGRRPDDVIFSKDVKEDVSRRDFTINAMVYNKKEGLLDLFGGREDLKNKLVRTVGNPDERFNEDYLRMLRCIRFATTLDFKIENNTFYSILNNSGKISKVSRERIREEFLKILLSDNPVRGLNLLIETRLYKNIMPSLDKIKDMDNLSKSLVSADKDETLRLLILFKYIDSIEDLSLLKPSNEERSIIKDFLEFDLDKLYSIEDVKRQMRDIKAKSLEYIIKAGLTIERYSRNMIDFNEKREYIMSRALPYKISHLNINGEDLKNMGIGPGPMMGKILKEVNELVIKNPKLNEKSYLIKYISEDNDGKIFRD